MTDHERRAPAPSFLAWRCPADADAPRIAEEVIAAWLAIDAALRPIVGARGSSGLLKRSLHLTRGAYAWLTPLSEGATTGIDLIALQAAFAARPRDQAMEAASAVFRHFTELLTSLVGPSLTGQLLRSLQEHPPGGQPAQDKTT